MEQKKIVKSILQKEWNILKQATEDMKNHVKSEAWKLGKEIEEKDKIISEMKKSKLQDPQGRMDQMKI